MKQTAVEWLAWEIGGLDTAVSYHYFAKKVEEAKEKEKEQMWEYIKKNYCIGHRSLEFHRLEFEQYYNQTYGGNK